MSKLPKQIYPLIVIFAAAIAALIAAKSIFVPPSFGDIGHYRADALGDNAAQEMAYVTSEVCYDCHDEIYDQKQGSHHDGVTCEVCHGPAAAHIEDEEVIPDAPRGRGYCPLCHEYNPSRPSGFPQIVERLHNPGHPCMTCHNPHKPTLPRTPQECSACHRDIFNTKMVSHHATLPCSQCHNVDDGHKTEPRSVRADKPTSRDVCGSCHSSDSDSNGNIPKINLELHNPRYLCWDCHYPHHPEAN